MVNKKQFFCIAFLIYGAVLSASDSQPKQFTDRHNDMSLLAKAVKDRTQLQEYKNKCIAISHEIQDDDGCRACLMRACLSSLKYVIDHGIEACDSEIEAIDKKYT